MSSRRADGALEAEVLGVLWAAKGPLTPGEVNDELGGDLAYTTAMTILARLWKKGLAERVPHSRAYAYAYAAVLSESEFTTQKTTQALESSTAPARVLAGFVGALSRRDVRRLRRLLGEHDGRA